MGVQPWALLPEVWRKLCLPVSPSNLREATGEGRCLGQSHTTHVSPYLPQSTRAKEGSRQSQGRVTC